MRTRPNPLVFLSSALKGGPIVPKGIRPERQRIYEHGQQYGHNAVWVDEIIEPNRGPDPFGAIDDFLSELENSKLYLALIATDWPGSRITVGTERANATFFETELFYAAVLGRPIAVIYRTDVPIPPDTAELIGLLQRALPRITWCPVTTAQHAEESAKHLVDQVAAGRIVDCRNRRGDFGSILHQWWRWREPDNNAPGLRWLDGRFVPVEHAPNQDVVEECLRLASVAGNERKRLSRLWIASRELMGVPHSLTKDESWLLLWNRVLSGWSTAAAWYGLHGHLELGYMGALFSLDDVRTAGHRLNPKLLNDPDWDRPFASLGSAYYAASHRVASRRYRQLGLNKALQFVDQAVSADPLSRSNVLAIRASILLKMHAYSASIDTYHQVLSIRQASGAPMGSIGEAMTELGFGLLFKLEWRRGRELLREGVALMEQASYGPGFITRGKRKYAASLLLSGQIREARRQYASARATAEASSIGVTG